ncbi:MAG TPA: ATPase, T2SS/T4P/T4SS family [Candidatus Omnitrophota bacterium]|nr:ATPase, T2SS/T4P/T4SS family [Candidatus Omnitrophota bacterium]
MTTLLDALLKKKLVAAENIEDAKARQIGAKKPLHELLVEMEFISEEALMQTASEVFKLPIASLAQEKVDEAVLKEIPSEKAKQYGVFPLRFEDNSLVVAMSNPQDIVALDHLSMLVNRKIKPVLARKSEIASFVERYYLLDDSVYDLVKSITDESKVEVIKDNEDSLKKTHDVSILMDGDHSPAVKLVNLILADAIRSRASDIHIEPFERFVEVRYRIDGNLRNIMKVPADLCPYLIVRLKILTELDISETRKTQDGRCSVLINGRKVDLRISVIPTFFGEKMVLRLLDKKEAQIDLDSLGFYEDDLKIIRQTIRKPQGMVLVTGPTGSGKTSTLYAALSHIKNETKNIVTIEDPVEYLIDGISQIQVNAVKNVTFANGLRSILRQDPNIILVGEIRDLETAEIAFRASLTGHLVLSTVHTNNALATIVRLLDIGLEPYLIGSSLILIVAQRLVRTICPYCKDEVTNLEQRQQLQEKFGLFIQKNKIEKLFYGKGCERCCYTGFLGRTAIGEILRIDERLSDLISRSAPQAEMLKVAQEAGLRTLADSGIRKILEGVTTIEEVEGVCDMPDEDVVTAPLQDIPQQQEVNEVTGGLRRALNKRFTILIVDDEEDIRRVLRMRLVKEGYDVIEACNGEQGIKAAYQNKPSLILMDIMMPVLDGVSATLKIKTHLETASIPVVMLTAKTDSASEIESLDAGADDYVCKPFDPEKLLARIRMLLKRRS